MRMRESERRKNTRFYGENNKRGQRERDR